MNRHLKSKYLVLCMVVGLSFVGALVIWLLLPKHTKTITTSNAVTKQPEMVILPGAKPIKKQFDTTDPDSIWTLVSKERPLNNPHFRPSNLEVVPFESNTDKTIDERSLRKDVSSHASKLFSDAKLAGFDLILASGFRSYELQQSYFNAYSSASGETEANMFSARPGQSEHQTGMAFDVSLTSRQCYLEVCFGETAAGKWVANNATSYGFIVRYPAEKTAITKYQYEPWHLRYVGKDLANALKQSGLSLDEAVQIIDGAR